MDLQTEFSSENRRTRSITAPFTSPHPIPFQTFWRRSGRPINGPHTSGGVLGDDWSGLVIGWWGSTGYYPPYLVPRQGGPIPLVVLWYGVADDVPLIQHVHYGLFKDGLMSNSYGVGNTSQRGWNGNEFFAWHNALTARLQHIQGSETQRVWS